MMARPSGLRSENFRVTAASWSTGETGRGGGGGGGLRAAVGLLAGPVPPLAEPVTEPVDDLDQRGLLVHGSAVAAGGGLVDVDPGGGDEHRQQEHDRVLEQGPNQGAGAGGAAEGEQDDHGGGQGDGAQAPQRQAGGGVVVGEGEDGYQQEAAHGQGWPEPAAD